MACQKVTYHNEREARLAAMTQVRSAREAGSPPLRPYKCPECWRWHLTRQGRKSYWRHAREQSGGKRD